MNKWNEMNLCRILPHPPQSQPALSTAYLSMRSLLSSFDIEVIALVAEGTDCSLTAVGLNESDAWYMFNGRFPDLNIVKSLASHSGLCRTAFLLLAAQSILRFVFCPLSCPITLRCSSLRKTPPYFLFHFPDDRIWAQCFGEGHVSRPLPLIP